MTDKEKLRRHIRSLLESSMCPGQDFNPAELSASVIKRLENSIKGLQESEAVNNFLDKEPATKTHQLTDDSQGEIIGDPIKDVKMNQMANELGSDEQNAPTTAVKAGQSKGGNDFKTGQRQANFQDKTDQA